MPEKGRYSHTTRKETAFKVRELAKNKDLTVDELINMLMKPTSKGSGLLVRCVGRVKAGNMVNHMARDHPKTIRG